ncbi:hypothetical protein CDV36_010962 [Fusarium kuroshium]|uniref:Uncharacterized protein n=1 Tax=Fusarium kuroshium TaxID=2010991 RepID=A0A3M2RVU5_9HYPO|nr:hypothetical protein CDV36_010962 [Fusarium kuroshium]
MMKDIYRSAHQVSVWLGHGMPKIERQDRGHHSSDSDDSDEDNESGSDSDSDTGSDGSSDGSSDERKDGEIDGASHLVVCCDSGDEGDEVGNEDPNEDVDEVIDDDEDSEFFPDFFVELMAADRGRPLDLAFFLEGCLKLRGVLNSPWWRRVWVIQEVSYARSVRFHYGRLVFSFAFLSGLFRKIKEHSGRWLFEEEDDETGRRGTVFDRVNRDMLLNVFRRVRVSVLTDEFFPLREMYNLSYSFKATDPRDRIFALLGVVDEASHGRCIVPDYESGTRDVFIHAMTAITCNTLDFSLLGYAGLATSRARYNDGEHAGLPLPSWVPDFAAFPGVLLNLGSARGDFYKASTARRPVLAKKGAICLAKADLDAPGKDEEDGHGPIQHGVPYPLLRQGNARCPAKHYDTLTVQGTMADTIIACGIEFHGDNDETALGAWETIDSVLTFFEDGLRMIRKLGTYPTREKAEEVLFRTIFANNSRDWFQPKKLGWLSGFKFKKLLRALRAEADAGRGHESLVGHSREKPSNALERLGASFTTIPVTRAGCGRKLFSTRRGYVGLASNGVMVGDEVWLINGAAVPFISRKCMVAADDDGAVVREFICEAYVHGIMNGEAFSFKDIKEGPLVFI